MRFYHHGLGVRLYRPTCLRTVRELQGGRGDKSYLGRLSSIAVKIRYVGDADE